MHHEDEPCRRDPGGRISGEEPVDMNHDVGSRRQDHIGKIERGAMWQYFIRDPWWMTESIGIYCEEASCRMNHGGGIKVDGSNDVEPKKCGEGEVH